MKIEPPSRHHVVLIGHLHQTDSSSMHETQKQMRVSNIKAEKLLINKHERQVTPLFN